jgi:hypothetical protein
MQMSVLEINAWGRYFEAQNEIQKAQAEKARQRR